MKIFDFVAYALVAALFLVRPEHARALTSEHDAIVTDVYYGWCKFHFKAQTGAEPLENHCRFGVNPQNGTNTTYTYLEVYIYAHVVMDGHAYELYSDNITYNYICKPPSKCWGSGLDGGLLWPGPIPLPTNCNLSSWVDQGNLYRILSTAKASANPLKVRVDDSFFSAAPGTVMKTLGSSNVRYVDFEGHRSAPLAYWCSPPMKLGSGVWGSPGYPDYLK